MATQPNPPDPPDVIAARYAAAAKQAVTAAAQVGIDAFDKVNGPPGPTPPPYKPADAINSVMQLAGAALAGTVSIARVALQVQWDRRILLVADNIASIVGTGLNDVLGVAEDAAQKINANSDRQQALVDSAIKLASIGALRGAEILETAIAGPGAYADPVIKRPFQFMPAKNMDATLAVTQLVRTQDGTDIKSLVTFDPPDAKLAANTQDFTIVINTAGLPSGAYQGTVTATDTGVPPTNVRTFNITVLIPETSDPPES
ncbi:MAG: hypothetical protein J2P17_33640 [Mycobacterium sp.]|nr:hypothetical protein [Mycobacterium sp.]